MVVAALPRAFLRDADDEYVDGMTLADLIEEEADDFTAEPADEINSKVLLPALLAPFAPLQYSNSLVVSRSRGFQTRQRGAYSRQFKIQLLSPVGFQDLRKIKEKKELDLGVPEIVPSELNTKQHHDQTTTWIQNLITRILFKFYPK